jgi:hypothetical protein
MDSEVALDSGLEWSGDLAPFDGCGPGDPPALLLSHSPPAGAVTAGSTVWTEQIWANCDSSTWVAATAEDAVSGVKLGPISETIMDRWGRERVLLPADVPPGMAVRLRFDAVAPLVNGPHPWQWQLVDEWVRWIESPTPLAEVEVSGGYGPFTVHTREEWEEAAWPVDGSDMDLLDLEYITIHYNGSTEDMDGDDDIYTDEDTMESLRSTQRYYLDSRGYSTGYNSEIAPDGDEWEIRGTDFDSAANGCTEVNRPSYSIQIPTSSPEADPTPAQIEGARAAILRLRRAAAAAGNPNWLYINGHRDLRPLCDGLSGTSCPGEPIYALILSGELEP